MIGFDIEALGLNLATNARMINLKFEY